MKAIFQFLWGSLKAFHTIAASIFFAFLIVIIANAALKDTTPVVPDGAALIVAPRGVIVEKERSPDPFELLVGEREVREMETSLWKLVRAIKAAKGDDQIAALVLSLDDMVGAGPAALHLLGDTIESFRESGKPVVAYGDNYSQSQYLLAAHADRLYLNPFGSLSLTGYGVYPLYFKSALDRIKANVNVFRIGAYKSAAEPFMRDSMSGEAAEANLAFLNVLWERYKQTVADLRGLESAEIQSGIDNIDRRLAEASGDAAQLAVGAGLVDELKTRQAVRKELIDELGAARNDVRTFKHVGVYDYLSANGLAGHTAGDRIGVIAARGPITGGYQDEDVIGAETVVNLIRKAREDSRIKALVLRLDTPGGSSQASELIRQELAATREAGMPVVVSLGSTGASGGYWIATAADQIWAAPTTVTGSIGVVGIVPTFENSLDEIGVHSDGVGTTDIAGGFSLVRPLSDKVRAVLQLSVEHGYRKFLTLVAENRGMAPEEVDQIAQGRVWAGQTAADLGLVDGLGDLDAAVDAAADLAEISEYDIKWVEERPDFAETILRSVMRSALAKTGLLDDLGRTGSHLPLTEMNRLQKIVEDLMALQDPESRYALCFVCDIR